SPSAKGRKIRVSEGDLPDIPGVALDRSVAGEKPHPRHVEHRFFRPGELIPVSRLDCSVTRDVASKICQYQETVVFEKRLDQVDKATRIFWVEGTGSNGIQRRANLAVRKVDLTGIVSSALEGVHLRRLKTKDEHVLPTDVLPHFDVGAV